MLAAVIVVSLTACVGFESKLQGDCARPTRAYQQCGNVPQVTVPVHSEECPVVARTGKWSIFAALQECCLSAVRKHLTLIACCSNCWGLF